MKNQPSSYGDGNQKVLFVGGWVVPSPRKPFFLRLHIRGELRVFERLCRANPTSFWDGARGGAGCINVHLYMRTTRLPTGVGSGVGWVYNVHMYMRTTRLLTGVGIGVGWGVQSCVFFLSYKISLNDMT